MLGKKSGVFILMLFVFFGTNCFASKTISADQAFQKLADEYFDQFYFPTKPTLATQLGIHQYDDKLEDYSREEIKREITELKKFEKRFQAIKTDKLDEQTKADRELIINNIRGDLLTFENIRPWEKDPDFYSSGITFSAFVIMERQFAPVDSRLRLLIAREKLMLTALQQAHLNLKNSPRIYTEIALEQLPGLIKFFEEDVPKAFADVDDEDLKKRFKSSNNAVIRALKIYQNWLKNFMLPRSHGDFRIGALNFRKKLEYDEMVDIPLEKLEEIDMANMRENQNEFIRIAKELAPNKTPQEILDDMNHDHPPPEKLLETFQSTFDTLIKFIKDKKIITIPSDIRPIMEETPPFLRATTFASMDTPGPFERIAREAYFNVTLPKKTWPKQQIEEFMGQFNYPSISSVAVHEAYPGHYVQFLWMHDVHDRVRNILGANSNAEGWAHYCEQMMLDEGYGTQGYGASNERETKMLRLGQLQNALLRNARFIVGIKMHTGQMSFDQAVDFLIKEGYLPRTAALMEAKRGTSDPTYLYYTLGKLQILKLRADLEKKEGASFNLQRFHDDFMRQGFPPIKIVRQALMHDDSPTL